jgi:galactokinase
MDLIKSTIDYYRETFGAAPEVVAQTPGRVNIIGEHTDYNEGYVLPIAIDRSMVVAAGKRSDDLLSLMTVDMQASVQVPLSHLEYDPKNRWSNYVTGVAKILIDRGYRLTGANICIRGTIPIGSGLSSSAALEVASAIALATLNNLPLTMSEIIHIAHSAESMFVGVQCGIMDQFTVVRAQQNHALFLDCQSMEYTQVPYPKNVQLIVCDTGIRRELTQSGYNGRHHECKEAVSIIANEYPGIRSLRGISWSQFQKIDGKFPANLRKRTRHVISENQRVLQSVKAMQANDLASLGELMTESHISLRDDYEVSCPELDAFVDIAISLDGVYGARMTGAGFGGSAICLAAENKIDLLVDLLRSEYPRRAGRSLMVYLASPSNGAFVIKPKESMTPVSLAQLA